ncbi:class I adenylate-forming enzyme family protein [Mycolicibacter heraklionensis]
MTDVGTPFGERLRILSQENPAAVALVVVRPDGSDVTLTWSELEGRANQWGRALAEAGAEVGSMVALAIPNSPDLVLATLGCWKIGAVPIPMRWDLPDWERQRLLEVIRPAALLNEQGWPALAASASHQSAGALPTAISPSINGICSSGSTGLPKVILNLQPATCTETTGVPFLAHWAALEPPQTILVPGPMYHTNGFNPLTYLIAGDRLVVLEKFDAAAVLDTIEKYRITNFTATPTMLARIANVPGVDDRDLSSLEWILQGAAIMPPDLLRRWFELIGPEKVVMAYGMTENLGLAALRGDEWLEHPGSVGRGFRDTEIRILDEDGSPVPTGELGDIYLRAPMNGLYRYLGGAAPLPATTDGFRSAGDMGHLDADGFLYIADRRSDMIVTGGANVFPAEVENALADHPEIADVVVLGLSDPEWGRRVHAVVQPTDPAQPPTVEQIIQYAKSRLAAYKVPKTVEFVDEIPRTDATKVNRSAMVEARGG